jgi:hypothetical protein
MILDGKLIKKDEKLVLSPIIYNTAVKRWGKEYCEKNFIKGQYVKPSKPGSYRKLIHNLRKEHEKNS